MKHLIPILLLFTLSPFHPYTLSAAVPLRWTVETSRAQPATFEAFQGETLDFEAALQSYGKPLEAPVQYAFYWQTNGMGSAYWSAPCTVPGASSPRGADTNLLRATWLPSYDVGARAYNCFIGLSNSIYHAAFQLRLRPSPGAVPNELPLPQKVIDFSQVTVLNPPWSGGGGSGGVDTNAVIDIIHETVDGSARPLPPYLHAIDFDDTYPDDAAWFYAQPQPYGSCSAVRDGGFLYRNYDWRLDDAAEFVVRVTAGEGRFASLGVANCGTNLTEQFVTSGKWSRFYKCLPGRTVDGINENGVVAEVNVVGGDPHDRWPTNGTIHCMGAVRWVLDHATDAGTAASNLVEHLYFPDGFTQNFHWMVADERETWIVENGACSNVTGRAVMTNFQLLPEKVYGPGWERYILLEDSFANITNAWYTRAYSRETEWVSEFKDPAEMEAAKSAWETYGRDALRGNGLWQTVHCSVYDITNRTLRVAVQEQPDWYTFAIPGGTGVSPVQIREIVQPMIADATNDLNTTLTNAISIKRDLTDLDVYDVNRTNGWTFAYTKDGLPYVPVIPMFDYKQPKWCETIEDLISMDPDYAWGYWKGPGWYLYASEEYNLVSSDREPIDTIEIPDEDNGAGFILYELHLTYNVKGRIIRVPGRLATTNDLNDLNTALNDPNTGKLGVHGDGDDLGQGDFRIRRHGSITLSPYDDYIFRLEDNNLSYDSSGVARFGATGGFKIQYGDLNLEEGSTLKINGVEAISTNNPAFVAAVLATGLNIDTNDVAVIKAFVNDWPVDPVTGATTIGGILTALAAAIALLKKNKLEKGLSDAGVPTDPNVQDLFSESNTSLKGVIAAKTATVATSATAPTSVTLADNDCKTVTMGTVTALQIDFGAAKQTGALRLCELVIADAPSTALTLSFPSGHTFHSSMASGKWYTTETGRNHFFFEETATNVWTVTRQVETSDTPTTTHAEGGAE